MNEKKNENVDIQSDRDVRKAGGVTTRALRFTSLPVRVWMHPDAAMRARSCGIYGHIRRDEWKDAPLDPRNNITFFVGKTRIRSVIRAPEESYDIMNTLSERANCLKNERSKQRDG